MTDRLLCTSCNGGGGQERSSRGRKAHEEDYAAWAVMPGACLLMKSCVGQGRLPRLAYARTFAMQQAAHNLFLINDVRPSSYAKSWWYLKLASFFVEQASEGFKTNV